MKQTGGVYRKSLKGEAAFMLPMLLCFVPVIIIPFFYAVYIGFMRWNGISQAKEFIGLLNYATIFTSDPQFWKSVWFSFRQTVAITVISNVLGLTFALLVSSMPKNMQGLPRTLLLLPNIMGGVIMGFIWRFIFQKVFLSIAEIPGLGFLGQSWLGEPGPAFWAIVIVSAWQYSGYTMIIYIAGLTGIDSDIKEAARLDGPSPLKEFFSITLPLIMPSVTVCIFWVMVKTFTMYDLVSSLTVGGPYGTTTTVSMNLYEEAFSRNNYGLGSAKAIVFFVFILCISLLQVHFTRSKEIEA